MKTTKAVFTMIMGTAMALTPALAQEGRTHEVSVQAVGSFVKTTTENGVQQSATKTGGVLASYRFFFDAHSGIEANYGFTNNTQRYGGNGIETRSHEVSAAYVYRIPLKRITPFVLAGAGGLIFDPRDTGIKTQTRAAFVYGGGADVNFSKHVFMRAEYRGFVYNSPTYEIPGLNGADRITHRAQPSLGFGYRF